MKISLHGLKSISEVPEERIIEFEDILIIIV